MLSVRLFVCLTLCLILPFSAQASGYEPLKDSDVISFLGSQDDLLVLAKEMELAGHETFFKPRPLNMSALGIPLYVNNVSDLKEEYPQYYAQMTEIVKAYRTGEDSPGYFSSAEDWAKNADRVMLAFYAATSKATNSGYDDMKKHMNPVTMAMLPAEARAMLENGPLAMMRSLQNVPDHDKAVVLKYKKPISLYFSTTSKH